MTPQSISDYPAPPPPAPRRPRPTAGFTLIELLITVVIIGILAMIAVPKLQTTKGKANTAGLKSDLRNLSVAQESYFYENQTYTNDTLALNLRSTGGVVLIFTEATGSGWAATTTHAFASPVTCGVRYGNAVAPIAAASQEGLIGCQ
ncbi:MAG: prepilin-type N-terminal cleavage/methylation domain-containing protein [Gemmatimonadota bacterium]|nr:prepilin-type N-terminal cleavage/methylation domain-containing protein [Gemmatimonadota bacterium]